MKVPCPASASIPPSRGPTWSNHFSGSVRSSSYPIGCPSRSGPGFTTGGQPRVLAAAGVQRCHHRPAAHELVVGTTYWLGTGVADRLATATARDAVGRPRPPSRRPRAGCAAVVGVRAVVRGRVDAADQHDVVEADPAHRLQPVGGPGVLEQDPAVGGDRGALVADGQVEPDHAEPRVVLLVGRVPTRRPSGPWRASRGSPRPPGAAGRGWRSRRCGRRAGAGRRRPWNGGARP